MIHAPHAQLQSSALNHARVIGSCSKNNWQRQFLSCGSFHGGGKGARMQHTTFADSRTAVHALDLFRPPKLSGDGPDQCWGGGPPGKPLGCCQLLIFFACSKGNYSRSSCQRHRVGEICACRESNPGHKHGRLV